MLGAINVSRSFALPFPGTGFPELSDFEKLFAFEPIQQDPPEALFKVLLDAYDDFLEEIGVRGAESAFAFFFVKVRVEDDVDGGLGRKWDKGEILGDVLPVVDQDGFEVVGNEEADRRARVECFFLEGIVNIGTFLSICRASKLGPGGFAAGLGCA